MRTRSSRSCSSGLFIFALFFVSCLGGYFIASRPTNPVPQVASSDGDTYPIDPLFNDFYRSRGGQSVLGPAITTLFQDGNLRLQFVETALLAYDINASPSYFLVPLGYQLGYSDPNLPTNISDGQEYVYDRFLPLYQELGGVRAFGRPLTRALFNQDRNRIEQHFENLGIYVQLDPPEAKPHLLAYGVYACDYACRYTPLDAAIIQRTQPLEGAFALAEKNFGATLLGAKLAGPYTTEDGMEVIFENMVLYAPDDGSSIVSPRHLPELLGFQPHNPVPFMNSPLVTFYLVEGNLGYNIPKRFSQFLDLHGGLDLSGPPISELFQVDEGQYRQCYQNLCLDYTAADDSVHPAPLGRDYYGQ